MPGSTLYCLGEVRLELTSSDPLRTAQAFCPRLSGSAAALALAFAAQGGKMLLATGQQMP